MKACSADAPGKVILHGEHAVVYGKVDLRFFYPPGFSYFARLQREASDRGCARSTHNSSLGSQAARENARDSTLSERLGHRSYRILARAHVAASKRSI